jgi:cysteine synthase
MAVTQRDFSMRIGQVGGFGAQVVDEWIRVSDADSFSIARRIAWGSGFLLLIGDSGSLIATPC